jgi:hypothetical protein
LSVFALTGLDYSTRNTSGELDLYDPATGDGMSAGYLEARTAMLRRYIGHEELDNVKQYFIRVQHVDGSQSVLAA